MKKFITLFFCTLLFACSHKQTESVPNTVLSKEKMAEVLTDIHLLEAMMNTNVQTPDKASSANAPIQPAVDVLKKNNISKKQYDESFDFYTKHPELLSEIYQLVLNNLSKMQAEAMNKK
jgi:hypothetical protein